MQFLKDTALQWILILNEELPDEEELECIKKELFEDAEYEDEYYDSRYFSEYYLQIFVESNIEDLKTYLNKYFENAEKYYFYYQNIHSGFGGDNSYLEGLSTPILYLCYKYFEFIGEADKANKCLLFMLCAECYNFDGFNESIFKYIEASLDNIKGYIYSDWLTLHPQLVWHIGMYYKSLENYEKAREYFEIGAELDYGGRQSIDPFIEVSKNIYELGLMYLNGLGTEKDYERAFSHFERTANECGEPSIPIMGDMYYLGLGVDKDHDRALDCYCNFNPYNQDKPIYFKEVNESQKVNIKELLDEFIIICDSTYEDLNYIYTVCKHRLKDNEATKIWEKKIIELIEGTPVENRTEEMDQFYFSYVLELLEKKLEKPTENTGCIPKDLKIGDTFVFGKFNNEPVEWKVLDFTEEGYLYVISTKILFKLKYDMAAEWLNTVFLDNTFTEDEKSHIKGFEVYWFRPCEKTYIYVPAVDDLINYEGKYEEGTIKETKLAESMSSNKEVMCFKGLSVLPNGEKGRLISSNKVRGVRPNMVVVIGDKEK